MSLARSGLNSHCFLILVEFMRNFKMTFQGASTSLDIKRLALFGWTL